MSTDERVRNEDWLKTRSWDIRNADGSWVTTLAALRAVLGPDMTVEKFMALPASEAMPAELRAEIEGDGVSAAGPGPRVGHRDPNEREVRAATDFAVIQRFWTKQLTAMVAGYAVERATQIADITDQVIASGGDLGLLSTITTTPVGQEVIAEALLSYANRMREQAVMEASAQGVAIGIIEDMEGYIATRSDAVARVLSRGLDESAVRKAIQIANDNVPVEEIAMQVREHLEGLSDRYLEDQLGGAMTAVQNETRMRVFAEPGAVVSLYASELLDENTCSECADIDGKDIADFTEAARLYPSGGYRDCLGGPRCRGTIVAVFEESDEGVVAHLPGQHDQSTHGRGKRTSAYEFEDPVDAANWVESAGEGWAESLSDEERAAVVAYTDIGGSFEANDALRAGADPNSVLLGGVPASVLDEAIRRSSFEDDVVVWRGSQTWKSRAWDWQDNPDPGFISTSVSRDVAEAYIDLGDESHTLYKITIKKGSPAVALHSSLPAMGGGEAEVLLPRVTRVSKIGGIRSPRGKAAIVEVEIGG